MRHLLSSTSPARNDVSNGANNGADSAYFSMRSDEDSAPPPPRIAPVSGVLSAKGDTVLRPIAYKPPVAVRLSSRSSASSTSLPSSTTSPSSWDRNSPSPSSGGIDSVLREKEAEIAYLRQTLEHNEQVIFKVYAEKEQAWLREIRHLHQQYEAKLLSCQQHHATVTSQLRKEKEQLEAEIEQLNRDNDKSQKHVKQLQEEVSNCRTQLEDIQWKLCHKSGEISLLKAQLRECQGGNASRVSELFTLKNRLQELQIEAQEKDQRISQLSNGHGMYERETHPHYHGLSEEQLTRRMFDKVIEEKSKECTSEIEQLRTELYVTRQNMQLMQQGMDEERTQWEAEKERVIRYQKQIQTNYKQMRNRNWSLECEVQQLILELENKGGESHC